MSTPQNNPLPDPQNAYGFISTEVQQKAFFNKLASFGIQPSTQKEAQDLLDMAGKLRIAQQNGELQKQAENGSRFGKALSALDNTMSRNPRVKQAAEREHDHAVRQAVAQLAGDPDIYNSVLSLKAAQADEAAAQLGLYNQNRPNS